MKKLLIIAISILFLFSIVIQMPTAEAATSITDITNVSEFGKVSTMDDDWATVTLENTYTNPVVIAKSLSYEGTDPSHVRIRNVTSNSFEMKVEEWDYLDGIHVYWETVSYLVIEEGQYLLDGKEIRVGTLSDINDGWVGVAWGNHFSTIPVLFSQSQTYNGGDAIVTRNKDVTNASFQLKVQEEEAKGEHNVYETIGYVLAEEGIYDSTITKLEVDTIITDSEAEYIPFYNNFLTTPHFFADMQTYNGGDPAGIRYVWLQSTGSIIFIEEEQSYDEEMNHADEVVGWFGLI